MKGLPGDATGHPESKRDMASKKGNGNKLGFILSRDRLRVTGHMTKHKQVL
jgi:hypothetical protein